jgi:hypothetical protein
MRFHLLAVVSTLFALPALAKGPTFAPIPADQTGGKTTGLQLRIVRYEGGTNGVISVEVKNPTDDAVDFSARGLYFVPNGNANEAPQRLGAVGPFSMKTEQGWQRRETTSIAAGEVVQLKLDVYCIDSHRSSPSSSTGFRLAKDRVPKKITDDIARDAHRAAQGMGGIAAPAAKSAVQSQVWKNRDKKWVELDGEGAQEAAKH